VSTSCQALALVRDSDTPTGELRAIRADSGELTPTVSGSRYGRPKWLPAGHMSTGEVVRALDLSPAEVRRLAQSFGGSKLPNGRWSFDSTVVRQVLVAQGKPVPHWLPPTPASISRRRKVKHAALGALTGLVGLFGVLYLGSALRTAESGEQLPTSMPSPTPLRTGPLVRVTFDATCSDGWRSPSIGNRGRVQPSRRGCHGLPRRRRDTPSMWKWNASAE
jgi:hypothetical protein